MFTFPSPIHSHVPILLEENIRYTRWVKKTALEGLELELFTEARTWLDTLQRISNEFLVRKDHAVFLINKKDLPLYTHPYPQK